MITGINPPDMADTRRWRELQSTCSKALKVLEMFLERALVCPLATNYFTKEKLSMLASHFTTRRAEFQVLRDNSEVVCSDLYVLLGVA